MTDLPDLTRAIEAGDLATATGLTRAAIEAGTVPQAILDAMTAAMANVGRSFQRGEIYVPEMLLAARAVKGATALLEPLLVIAGIRTQATAVIGTVSGDLHDIGKNLVTMMWRSANLEVVDLGTNVSTERFVAAAREHGARIVGLSALVTTTMGAMRDVVEAFRVADLPGTKVVIGGAPITAEYAAEIGADGYAPDAGSAVELVRRLLADAP